MPDFDDEDATRVTCPACGGDTRRDCSLCEGHGSVTAAVAAVWRFERAGRIAKGSGEHRVGRVKAPLPQLPDEGHRDDEGPGFKDEPPDTPKDPPA